MIPLNENEPNQEMGDESIFVPSIVKTSHVRLKR
jgi:hypothetical protein